MNNQRILAYETYVWSEKIVLIGGDSLRIQTGNPATMDIWYNYLDQSWV